ncbi:hypothetical protein NDU88_001779 [Pleurodeles waltl]|uniref:Uncharacterized protein n=1 Tax=Pleurodeles waltl TaxID=8319 RepID=A0AAV7T0N8_PLEWA|nr:hypothetical protein NDU88_001779 [Pleurodeles waltl]
MLRVVPQPRGIQGHRPARARASLRSRLRRNRCMDIRCLELSEQRRQLGHHIDTHSIGQRRDPRMDAKVMLKEARGTLGWG